MPGIGADHVRDVSTSGIGCSTDIGPGCGRGSRAEAHGAPLLWMFVGALKLIV